MRVVVVGSGIGGLLTALLLSGDGHDVTVLERDAEPPPSPDEAWDQWDRRGVNQFRLLHFFLPRFRAVLERELPGVVGAVEAAGALRMNIVRAAPEVVTGGWREGDEQYEFLTARRPVMEAVLAAAAGEAGIDIRRGTAVDGLVSGPPTATGVAHVTGVRLAAGDRLEADLVVDASGRRSPLPRWLTALGARPPVEELEDSGFLYYGRHLRSDDGSTPIALGPLLQAYGSISVLTLPADNGTWGIGVITSAKDVALRPLKDADRWTTTVSKFPLLAHWLDGTPLSDSVDVIAKIEDRHRSFAVDGTPVATGVVAVADAWACTNPSLGRGATMGFLHAVALRDLLRETTADDPLALAKDWAAATEATVEGWYRDTLGFDRHRLAEIDAITRGEPYEPGDPTWEITQAMGFASLQDPDVLRGFLQIASLTARADEVLAQPGLVDKIVELGSGWRDAPPMGPNRDELLATVNA